MVTTDHDLFLARLCEWATITKPGVLGEIDAKAVQQLVTTVYGQDWVVTAGSGGASPDTIFHLPYLCVSNQSTKHAVLVFKRSDRPYVFATRDAWNDWINVNLRCNQIRYRGFTDQIRQPGTYVHSGFANAWWELRDGVFALLDAASASDAGWSLSIAGHSLGGSLAQLFFVDAVTRRYLGQLHCDNITARSFGAPLVANGKFWGTHVAMVDQMMDSQVPISVDAAFYESEHEMFGASDPWIIGLFALFKSFGYEASPFAMSLPIDTADWAVPTPWGSLLLTHHIETYIEYLTGAANSMLPPRPPRLLASAKTWTVVFLTVEGAKFTTSMSYPLVNPDTGHRDQSALLFSTEVDLAEGSSLILQGSRPSDWVSPSLNLWFDYEPGVIPRLFDPYIRGMVIYVDDLECWRKHGTGIPAGADDGMNYVYLHGFE